jgi:hypothetical protein
MDCIYLLKIHELDNATKPAPPRFRGKPPVSRSYRKTMWWIPVMLLSLSSFAQSTASDAYLTVNYVGYDIFLGQYQLQVVSKQAASCNPDITITWQGATISSVSPGMKGQINNTRVMGDTTLFSLTGAYVSSATFTVTDLSICQWQGSSPKPITVSAAPASLPIVLNYFRYQDGAFQWQTAQESNSAYFQVQRQADGDTSWNAIATVTAAGNSSTATSYEVGYSGAAKAGFGVFIVLGLLLGMLYKGRKALVGLAFLPLAIACTKVVTKPAANNLPGSYRLVEVDKDGTPTYSKIIHI